jgi:hypothetical protein
MSLAEWKSRQDLISASTGAMDVVPAAAAAEDELDDVVPAAVAADDEVEAGLKDDGRERAS